MATYRAAWNGIFVRWRDLTWAEYQQSKPSNVVVYPQGSNLIDTAWAQEVYKLCLISGPDPTSVSAGIVQQIATQQLIDNPFSGSYESINKALNYAKDRVNSNYLLASKALIAAAFHYKMEEMEDWTPGVFFTRLVQAQIVLGEVIQLKDPNAKPVPIKAGKNKPVVFPTSETLTRPKTPSQHKGTIGDDNVPKNRQRGTEVETHTVYSSKYPPK